MAIDPELLKQLIVSFSTELDEHTQAITSGLLDLEKNNLSNDDYNKIIKTIFRSAHNIKGTSKSIGINDVSEIAHSIESIFTLIQQNSLTISLDTINLCLDAVDKMKLSLKAFIEKKPLPFNLQTVINNLEKIKSVNNNDTDQVVNKEHHSANQHTVDSSINISTQENKSYLELGEHDTIRVSTKKIEMVSSLLEEIQINRIALMDHYTELTQVVNQSKQLGYLIKQINYTIHGLLGKNHNENIQKLYNSCNDCFSEIHQTTSNMHKNMRDRINELTSLTHSLQDEVGLLRMIPISNLLCTFPRYVRDLSIELNKKVSITIKGDTVRVDKAVLDGLKDPLIHLLRNAIDHGIEYPDDRIKMGKPEEGHIVVNISEENSKIIISITDDGRGIDAHLIKNSALNKKIISESESKEMQDDEILNLIFNSGFSTKDVITDTSGRGVGLDVVKFNIHDLKGELNLTTKPHMYTTFTLTVPLSISSEQGLLIMSSGQHFVIPTTSVERVFIMPLNKIIDIQDGQAIMMNERTVPLRLLSDILQLENKPPVYPAALPIVVIKRANQAVALLVDEIIGEREIVIKPFQKPLTRTPCITGGTLLESSQVIMVLEPKDLIERALKSYQTTHFRLESESVKQMKKRHILVVDDSITTRTLEKSVLENKNFQVTLAVNGKDAWDILQNQSFDLMITDVSMPIMDGFTLTEHVKTNPKLQNMPVIIVTSLGSDAEKKRGIDVGADAYIVKNEFESGELLNVISQLV